MKTLRVGIIYKITYPNGKIYIGQDRTDDINYFGSACSFTIAADLAECRDDITIRKQVLGRWEDIDLQCLNRLEYLYIKWHKSNDPAIGYNRTGVPRKLARTVWSA